ncbi:autotransporter outer membrane beta-barrel domain-containing protein [Chromobacterium amazonense]|uniref:Autotransporter domain-containing protein n=1 Tax=Chromobacterium amazonense TaxID=1382803 RepID=A0ABU8V027_9NEIS|nr:autotransporter domain-containing protein [Chromobacterium amazonense]MDQ4539680.1 autotransporter domain-containing protein [Chromobacterium amazonense]
MRIRLTALALATAMALPAAAHAYSNIYFFGDSLSDVGAFQLLPTPTGGQWPLNARWTTGNGANWTDVLSGHYGLKSVANNPSNANTSKQGNNYAQGGAIAQDYTSATTNFPTAAAGIESVGPDNATKILELPTQIQNYLTATGGKADANALYTVWIGGNDVIAALSTASSTTGQKFITASAQAAATSVAMLERAGAKTIIVPTLPDMSAAPLAIYASLQAVQQKLGLTDNQVNTAYGAAWQQLSAASGAGNDPKLIQAALAAANSALSLPTGTVAAFYNGTSSQAGVQPSLQQLSSGYNQLVDMMLSGNNLQHNVVRANVALLFQEILANPGKYGFTNVTGSACPQSAISCPANVLPNQVYVFTDPLHPTPAAHKLIGDYTYGLLQAPLFAAAMPESALNNARQLGSALDARYQAIRSQQRAVGTVSAFLDGAFNQDKIAYNGLESKPKGQLYTLGLDFQASPSLSLGLAMSRQQGKSDVTSSGTPGTLNDRTTLMAGLVSYKQDKFWIDGDVHVGSGDVDTSRSVTEGPATINIGGKTRQTQYGMRIGGGYRLQYGSLTHGPVAGLDFAHAKVGGFTEQGGNSSSMSFNEQTRSSLVGRVGWQLDATIGQFSPYAKVSYAHEFKQDDRNVTAGLATAMGDWTTNLGKPASNWMEWTAGVSANFNKKVTAFGQLTATSGKNGGNQTGGNIGVAVSF